MLSKPRTRPIIGLATLAVLSAACSDRTPSVVDPSLRAAARSPSANLVGTTTVWDFASLAGFTGPLGNPASFTIAGAGTIVATAQMGLTPAAQVYSKGFELPIGSAERGLGLCRAWDSGQCIGPQDSEIGDDYTTVTADGISPYLVLDFSGLTPGSTVQSVTLGSLQLGEGYEEEWSVDGLTWTVAAQHETGPTDPLVVTLSAPTGARFLRFDRDPSGGAGDNYVLMSLTTVSATITGTQGCTPGYWKQTQHFASWVPTGYTQGQLLSSVFTIGSDYSPLGNSSLLDALSFGGGSTLSDKAQILLRAAVSALLNAGNPSVAYALTTSQIVTQVNSALASEDPNVITNLATSLNNFNNGNGGCPLN